MFLATYQQPHSASFPWLESTGYHVGFTVAGGKGKNAGRAVEGHAPLTEPLFPPYCLFHSSAPTGYTSFSINASPGVVVDVAHSPPAKKNTTGSSKWSLDPSLEVSLRMKAASSSTGDQKVSVAAVGWDVWEEVSSGSRSAAHGPPRTDPQPPPWQSVLFSGYYGDRSSHGILADNTGMLEGYGSRVFTKFIHSANV